MLGYFSIIGLLRVHVLLGDFTLALKVMENVELNQKVGFSCAPTSGQANWCFAVAIYTCHRLSRRHILLCWVLLYYAATIHRCHSFICHDSELHHADAPVPHTELPVRPSMTASV